MVGPTGAPAVVSTMTTPDGARIDYRTVGAGPAVLVIPGALSVAADYTAFAIALAERFTVHIIERRGRGGSSPQGADYSIATEREDTLALQRQTGASLLVGHSYGGLIALEAARNNAAITGVAVYEPGVSINGSIPTAWMRGYEEQLAAGKPFDAFVAFVRGIAPESAGKTPPWLMKRLLPLFLGRAERAQIVSLLEQNLREHREVARLDDSYPAYREVAARTLLMYGGKGHSARTAGTIRQLAATIPRAEILAFPQLDHFGIDKKAPREVARAVSAYFARA